MPWVNLTGQRQRLSQRTVINRMRKRRYQWGKPLAEIANEAGLSYETILAVIKGQPMTEEVHARLIGYLKTPAGPFALINDREKKAYQRNPKSRRILMTKRVEGLRALAGVWGFKLIARSRIAEMTMGELWAYFWNLDEKIKNHLMERFPIASLYLIPDSLNAWEWIERLEKLNERNPGSFAWPSSQSTATAPPTPTSLTAQALAAGRGGSTRIGTAPPQPPSPGRA